MQLIRSIFLHAAFLTYSVNLLSMREHLEIEIAANLHLQLFNAGMVKFQYATAFDADEVVVMRMSQNMLIGASTIA